MGDPRSLVVDSQYEYVPGQAVPVCVLEALPEPAPIDIASVYTLPEDEQQESPAISPLEPDHPNEPQEDQPDEPAEEMTMFEVVRATVQANPLISLGCLLLVLAVIVLAGYHRYRRIRGRYYR